MSLSDIVTLVWIKLIFKLIQGGLGNAMNGAEKWILVHLDSLIILAVRAD